MTRRTLLGAGLGAAAAPAIVSARAQSTRPNIILVLSDDHSAPYLGCYGDPAVRTPHIDKMAAEGMRFDRAFTAAPQCVPSRTAYLSGRSPVSARMGRFSSPLPPDIVTFPELLRGAGYFTGVLGRQFHLDGPGTLSPEMQALFDRTGVQTFKKRFDYVDASGQPPVVERVNQFFDRRPSDKPFFLWVNYSDPHHVWTAQGGSPVDPAKVRMPGHFPDLPGMRGDLARYLGEVEHLDADFGRLLETFQARRVGDNTLMIFAGDNGMAMPHGKGSLYDPGLHVPMIVRWPGRIKPGTSTRSLISGEDVGPTCLDAAGIAPAKGMTGQSFLKLLTGEAHTPRRHIFGARLYHGNAPLTPQTKSSEWDQGRCVRTDKYKLIFNATPWMEYQPTDSAGDPGWQDIMAAYRAGTLAPQFVKTYFTRPRPIWELYDLDADPSEMNNLIDKPELAPVVQELKMAMQEKALTDYDFLPLPLHITPSRR